MVGLVAVGLAIVMVEMVETTTRYHKHHDQHESPRSRLTGVKGHYRLNVLKRQSNFGARGVGASRKPERTP